MARDYCSGVRKAYYAITKALASNNIVAALFTGIPYYYLFGVGTYQTRMTIGYYSSVIWVFSAILIIAWLIGLFAMWKTMPNLLTFTIFIYKAFGYWCLVSFFIVVCYLTAYIPSGWLGFVVAAILPSILFLLVCADVLREVRTRLYKVLETPPAAAAAAAATAVPVVDARSVV
jgi:hypothetical protein